MRFHKLRPETLQTIRRNLDNPEYMENAIVGIGLRTADSLEPDPKRRIKKKLNVRRFIK